MRKTHSDTTCWQRVEAVIKHYQFPSVSAFARHIGLNRSENLYQIKRGNNGISRELAENICAHFLEVSLAWLLAGEGHMLTGEDPQDSILKKIREIPFFVNVPENYQESTLDSILYCSPELAGNADLATFYRGNALMPTYKSGAILFLKEWIVGDELVYGDVYYIRTGNFSKFRIVRCGSDSHTLRLTSFAPEKYDDMLIDRKEIISLYHVCGANIT